jgi:hypothetical protein
MSRLLAFEHAMAALRALIELLIGLGILIGAVCKTAPAH